MANFYVSSGTSFSATINITYPSGATCTVSNYKKTWTAPNTTGSWSCKVNDVGIYTVKITKSSKSRTTTVAITANKQTATATLSFELVLFDGGDKTAITGGWESVITAQPYGSGIVRNDKLTVGTTLYWLPGRDWNSGGTDQKNRSGYIKPKNVIDVSEYSTITAVSLKAKGHLTVGSASVALAARTVTLDISGISGNQDIKLGDTVSGDNCSEVEISKLYLS